MDTLLQKRNRNVKMGMPAMTNMNILECLKIVNKAITPEGIFNYYNELYHPLCSIGPANAFNRGYYESRMMYLNEYREILSIFPMVYDEVMNRINSGKVYMPDSYKLPPLKRIKKEQ